MILTGNQIAEDVEKKRITIYPYELKYIEPNSYGFHLNNEILEYDSKHNPYLDIKSQLNYKSYKISEEGLVLKPGKFYLGSTLECMGSNHYAETLLANLSTATMGMWIQFSAPLGHIGAIINWTLEITVTQKVKVYPYMKIGKIAFWKPKGAVDFYQGKYVGSTNVVVSRIRCDYVDE